MRWLGSPTKLDLDGISANQQEHATLAPELERALRNYLRLLSINPPHPAKDRVRQIRTLAEGSECTLQFSHLAKATKARFAKNPDHEGDESWRISVQHVLRRARMILS